MLEGGNIFMANITLLLLLFSINFQVTIDFPAF